MIAFRELRSMLNPHKIQITLPRASIISTTPKYMTLTIKTTTLTARVITGRSLGLRSTIVKAVTMIKTNTIVQTGTNITMMEERHMMKVLKTMRCGSTGRHLLQRFVEGLP
jgi:hypothetical protein